MYHPLISSYPCIYSLLSILSLYQSCNLHPILVSTLYSPSCPCFKHLLPILSLYHPLISSYPCIYSLLSILSFYQSCSLHPIFVSILYSPSYPCPLLSIISFPFYLSQYPLLVLSHGNVQCSLYMHMYVLPIWRSSVSSMDSSIYHPVCFHAVHISTRAQIYFSRKC